MSPQPAPPTLSSVENLLFQAPLYATFSLSDDMKHVEILYGRVSVGGRFSKAKVDAFCPFCKRDATFEIDGISIPGGDPWTKIKERIAFDQMTVSCTRNEYHTIRYFFRVQRMTIAKVGQFPSLADVAIEETRTKYRSVLRGDNWSEFYKAIGLAAHGEGIASFVYLRRVFERLIQARYREFKESEGWSDEEFSRLKMDEKVLFLKGHLPEYLVQIRKIYSIFSVGIHELDNDQCLRFFEIGKRSIVAILEEDIKKKEELAARDFLAKAIADYERPSPSQPE